MGTERGAHWPLASGRGKGASGRLLQWSSLPHAPLAAAQVAETKSACDGDLQSKIDAAERKFAANQHWIGLSGKIGGWGSEKEPPLVPIEHKDSAVCCPWLVSLKRFGWGHGAFGVPLAGLPMWLQPENADAFLTFLPIEKLLSSGIVLNDFKSFLETPTGQSWCKQNAATVLIPTGVAVRVPGGMFPLLHYVPVSLEAEEEEEGPRPKQNVPEYLHTWVLPVPSARELSSMPRVVATAVYQYHSELHSRETGSSWTARAAALTEMWKNVGCL